MIFLSHTHDDKPFVEPIAIKLKDIFGQDKVFYDSWSIQPGDGIIDRMNEGLTAPDFVFFSFLTRAWPAIWSKWNGKMHYLPHQKAKPV